MEVNSSI